MPILAAAQYQRLDRQSAGRREIGRVGDDLGDAAEPGRLLEVGVRRHQDRDRTQSGQRRDGDQGTRAGVHQHPHPGALANPDLDQSPHHVVDAPVDRPIGVHPPVEQQEFTIRSLFGLLGDDPAQRDPGVVVDLAEAHQPGQRARRFDRQCPHREVSRDNGVGRALGQRRRQLRGVGDAEHQPGVQRYAARFGVIGMPVLHQRDIAGRGSRPATHSTQSATVGQVMVAAFDPTTRPKWPARIIIS